MAERSGGRSDAGRPPTHSETVESWTPLDAALAAHRAGDADATLVMRTDVGGEEDVPAALFFRSAEAMSPLERAVLVEARGRILDVGAGAGAHAIPLARAGLAVTALEILPAACEALTEGGVPDVRQAGLESLAPGERFDTVLALMNGLGLPGTLHALAGFLTRLASCLEEGGQILADSTDPRGWSDPEDGRYPGEVHMQLEFTGAEGRVVGPPFPFLFVDPDTLRDVATAVGLSVEVLVEDEDGRYLARLRRTDA